VLYSSTTGYSYTLLPVPVKGSCYWTQLSLRQLTAPAAYPLMTVLIGLQQHVGVIFSQLGCDYHNMSERRRKGNWRREETSSTHSELQRGSGWGSGSLGLPHGHMATCLQDAFGRYKVSIWYSLARRRASWGCFGAARD